MENKHVIGILNIVEDKLREFGIMLPADEREGSTDPIVGYHYAELHDRIQEYLEEEGLLPNRSEAVSKPKEPINIKVIVNEGIVDAVLKDKDDPIQVEVIDIDKDYEDYEELEDYKNSIHADSSYMNCNYTVAHFEEGDYELSKPTYLLCMAQDLQEYIENYPDTWKLNSLEDCITKCEELRKYAKESDSKDYFAAWVVEEDGSVPWQEIFDPSYKRETKHMSEIRKGDVIFYNGDAYTAGSDAYLFDSDIGKEWNVEVDSSDEYLYASSFSGGYVDVLSKKERTPLKERLNNAESRKPTPSASKTHEPEHEH